MLQLFLVVISQKFYLQKEAWVGIKKRKKRRETSVSSKKRREKSAAQVLSRFLNSQKRDIFSFEGQK
jgi:hypothetical protein